MAGGSDNAGEEVLPTPNLAWWGANPIVDLGPASLTADNVNAEELSLLANNVPTLCWIANADGYILWYNRVWHLYCGMGPGDLEGWRWQAVLDPDRSSGIMDRWKSCIATGELFEMVFSIRGADGALRPFLTRVQPVRNVAGDIIRWYGVSTHIGEQVAAERELREERDRINGVLEHMGEGFALFDRDLRIVRLNAEALRLDRRRPEEIIGKTHAEAYPQNTALEALYREALRDQKPVSLERRYAQSEIWLEMRAYPLPTGELAAFHRDVTSRWRADEALREERHRLETLNRTGAAIAGELDLEALVQHVTDAGVELTGAQFGAFFYNVIDRAGGSYMLYTLSGAERSQFENFGMPRATAIFAPTFAGECVVRSDDITKDPRYGRNEPHVGMPKGHLPVRSYLAVPVKSRSGEVIGGLFFGHADVGVFTDQSERGLEGLAAEAAVAIDNARLVQALQRELEQRRAAEAELADSEARRRLANEAASVGTWDYDPQTGRLGWDAKCKELFGLPADAEVTYEGSFVAGLHPEDRERTLAAVQAALARDGAANYDLEYRTIGLSDGRERWVAAKGRAMFEDGVAVRFIGTVMDITTRKHIEERLRTLNERLEQEVQAEVERRTQAEEALRQAQKMEAIGQLTGGLAHDFNNLLAGISGSLEVIERRISRGAFDGIDRFIGGALASTQRAAALTQRLLAFSRRQTLDPKPTDVNRLVMGMEDLIHRTIGPAIKLEVVGAAGLWPAKLDAAQLESALLNLAINARDAMPEGGRITIETANKWIDTRAAQDRDLPPGQYISICVTDTGTGIPKELIERIFDPFFTTKPIGQGTGLGLSMIHGFVRQSGGQVRVYSEPGQGTTMCLYFPRYTGELESEADHVEGAIAHVGAGETVLVIDDEPTVRMLIIEVLKEAGYTALEADDARSGLRILQSGALIDLLITDVGLPGGMNGRQVADAARVTRPDLKVLFVTGFAENAAVGSGHLEPGMAVITKPFVIAELAQKISEMIEG